MSFFMCGRDFQISFLGANQLARPSLDTPQTGIDTLAGDKFLMAAVLDELTAL